ncbi:unnamed protein product [Brachionus calyciflorus]|uniref:MULE transposase domain-containing protein n=1 Tax=Brachionus calyciflorus TaxID=104777 RepID=A0A814H2Z9_9BILA|nr:unnamed protein product [Brachionus calyciflorus]
MTTSHSNSSNYTICPDNDDQHKMRTSYPYCQCLPDCPTRYSIAKCLSTKYCIVKGLNTHEPELQLEKTELTKKKEHNLAIPSLGQIQNYMKYRRKKDGDINSIVGLVEHVESKYYENIDLLSYGQDEPFYFGSEINEGGEDCHFHLGITSKSLLENIRNGCSFHFDCTYKIVKYGFPLIVFGCSDIRRKFYPICYFITSHEQEKDFIFFWESLIKIAKLLDIDLINIIDYLVIDADRASFNSILKTLTNTTVIMCWYHLIANINKNSSKIPKSIQDFVVNDIRALRNSTSLDSYELKKRNIISKWKKKMSLRIFLKFKIDNQITHPTIHIASRENFISKEIYLKELNADKNGPLYKQPWVTQEIKKFHESMREYDSFYCNDCSELWPTKLAKCENMLNPHHHLLND